MKLRVSTDLLSGLLFLGLGVSAVIYASHYPLGTASRMGAGYFPRLVSLCLIGIGAVLVVRSLRASGDLLRLDGLRPLAFVLLGTLSFGLLIERGGLLLAGFVLVVVARLASNDFRAAEVVILAVVLILSSAFLFSQLLGLSIPILPRWW